MFLAIILLINESFVVLVVCNIYKHTRIWLSDQGPV